MDGGPLEIPLHLAPAAISYYAANRKEIKEWIGFNA
jgi:hypothetical protein